MILCPLSQINTMGKMNSSLQGFGSLDPDQTNFEHGSSTQKSSYTEAISQQDPFERLGQLREEVTELRDIVTRFAEITLNELKRIQPPEPIVPPSPFVISNPISGILSNYVNLGNSDPLPKTAEVAKSWLLLDFFRDIRTTFSMYLDARYRLRRATQLFVPMIIGLFFLNHLFFSNMLSFGLITAIPEKMLDILLSVLLYKILYREMVRYREVIDQFQQAVNPNLISNTETKIITNSAESPHQEMDIERT